MSTSQEKIRAVLLAGSLLRELKSLECSPEKIDKVRKSAEAILRHYPNKRDVDLAAKAMHAMLGVGAGH